MKNSKWLLMLLLFLNVCLLSACNQDLGEVREATSYRAMLHSHHVKSGAKVDLVNAQVDLEVSGVQYAVNIDLQSGYENGELKLSIFTSEGLYIVGGEVSPVVTLSKGVISLPLTLIAAETGRYYVYLNGTVEKAGQVYPRSLTFIVQVGKEELGTGTENSASQELDGVEKVISMPAKEEITTK